MYKDRIYEQDCTKCNANSCCWKCKNLYMKIDRYANIELVCDILKMKVACCDSCLEFEEVNYETKNKGC